MWFNPLVPSSNQVKLSKRQAVPHRSVPRPPHFSKVLLESSTPLTTLRKDIQTRNTLLTSLSKSNGSMAHIEHMHSPRAVYCPSITSPKTMMIFDRMAYETIRGHRPALREASCKTCIVGSKARETLLRSVVSTSPLNPTPMFLVRELSTYSQDRCMKVAQGYDGWVRRGIDE